MRHSGCKISSEPLNYRLKVPLGSFRRFLANKFGDFDWEHQRVTSRYGLVFAVACCGEASRFEGTQIVLRYIVFCALLINSSILRADLLIEPSGTNLAAGKYDNGVIDEITLGSQTVSFEDKRFQFFGKDLPDVFVRENGTLSSPEVTGADFYPQLLSSTSYGIVISPLWDDFILYDFIPGNAVWEEKNTNYYAVTWKNVLLGQSNTNNPTVLSTQVVLFGKDSVINGFSFKTNDIAFSYENINANFSALVAEAGLRLNDNEFAQVPVTRISGAPNDDNDFIGPQDALDGLPLGPNQFILFRPTTVGASTNYTVTFEGVTAVPEPSSVALVLGALVPPGWRAARKKLRKRYLAKQQR